MSCQFFFHGSFGFQRTGEAAKSIRLKIQTPIFGDTLSVKNPVVHPRKPTYPLKNDGWKTILSF